MNVSDVFGHLASSDHILMILKAMILSSNYCSDDLIVTAKEVLKELYDRYGDEEFLTGIQGVNRIQYSLQTLSAFTSILQNHTTLYPRFLNLLLCGEDNIEYRTNVSKCWRDCIENGFISDACSLVSRHMNSTLKASDLSGLKLKQLAPSLSLSEVIQFVNESFKPTLLRLRHRCGASECGTSSNSESIFFKNIVLGLCVDLCNRATSAVDVNDGSAFDQHAIAAAQIAVDVLKIVVDADVCKISPWKSQLTKAMSLLLSLQLQRYLWINCDSPMSLKDVMSLGLAGIISHRLLTIIPENSLSEDISERVEPLCRKFDFNLEAHLEQLLRDVVNTHVVVSTEADLKEAVQEELHGRNGNDGGEDDSEGQCKVTTLSRLVKFLNFIITPSLKASATLLLFQIPATVEALASKNGGSKAAELLLHIAEECIQSSFVDLRTVDFLKEVMRSHRLRMLAGKYLINNVDIRDSAHIRSAVGVIAAQCSGVGGGDRNPILDTIEFGTLNADPSSVYGRALVHCVTSTTLTTTESTNVSGNGSSINGDTSETNPQIASLLSLVPQYRLVHIIEDACTCLFQSMHQHYSTTGFHVEDKLDKAELIASCKGCIQIISYFLDKHRGVAGEAYSVASLSWLGQDVLMMLKKLLILQTDLDLFISPRVMMDKSLCKDVVKQICKIRVAELSQQGSSSQNINFYPFTSESRKVGSLLGVSSTYLGHSFLQELLHSGQSSHAISMARLLGTEPICNTTSAPSSSEDPSYTSSSIISSEDAELLLDASITLVRLISDNQLRTPVGVLAKTRQADGVGNMDSFTASKDMLGSLAGSTPPSHLEQCVDLLVCNDLIISVQDRVQPSSSLPYEADDLTTFSLSNGTKYSKDGILMTTGSIQGPVLKLAYQETQRRWKKGCKYKQSQQDIPQVRHDRQFFIYIYL